MAQHCGLDGVGYTAVRQATYDGLVKSGDAFKAAVGGKVPETPAKILFQGVVDGYVCAVNRAAEFRHDKVGIVRDVSSQLGNEDRGERRADVRVSSPRWSAPGSPPAAWACRPTPASPPPTGRAKPTST